MKKASRHGILSMTGNLTRFAFLAQPDRASDFYSVGSGFESWRARQLYYRFIYIRKTTCYSKISNQGNARKGKEMILLHFTTLFKSEYQDRSLWSSNYEPHSPLVCPYKTRYQTVKRQP